VMAYAPALGVLYFPKLDPGQRVLMSSGHRLLTPTHSSGTAAYAPPYGAALDMEPGAREDTKRVWNMFGSHFHYGMEWWPRDVPILLAELDTPKGASDTGFKMKNDRTVVRIVGTHTPATALKKGAP
ncbi:MAG: hypothetical protein KBF88_13185, partial [Polyangiaceae bacterium]|nr:hypothetical protein [Polyangiaceae bacterium]